MQKYLSDTRALIKKGDYEEALERCVWFHEHALEHDKGMTGVRLSFALSEWKSLGKVYQPALDSLIAIRDRKTSQLVDNAAPTGYFGDVSAINETLGESKKTIELFEILSKAQNKNIKVYWAYAKYALFAAKRYDIIQQYIGNPLREFSLVLDLYNLNTSFYKSSKISSAHFKSYNENDFIEKSLELIRFSVAVEDKKSAKKIQQKALKIVEDHRLRDIIIGAN